MFFFFDFEKAFDSANPDYKHQCVEHFNFGNGLINWVKIFYSDAKSCVSNNSNISDLFLKFVGIKARLSVISISIHYLYRTFIECSHKNEAIKGISIAGRQFRTSLFADDASFIMHGTRKFFETLINIMDNFSYISGLCLNANKVRFLE